VKLIRNETRVVSSQGDSTAADANDDVFLTAAQVRRRYGAISAMTLHRWLHDSDLNFCQPIVIGNRRYWKRSDLEKFERHRVGEKATTNKSQGRGCQGQVRRAGTGG
jgi:hypothetical protein